MKNRPSGGIRLNRWLADKKGQKEQGLQKLWPKMQRNASDSWYGLEIETGPETRPGGYHEVYGPWVRRMHGNTQTIVPVPHLHTSAAKGGSL